MSFQLELEASLLAILHSAPFQAHRAQAGRILGTEAVAFLAQRGVYLGQRDEAEAFDPTRVKSLEPMAEWASVSRYGNKIDPDPEAPPRHVIPLIDRPPTDSPLSDPCHSGPGGGGPKQAEYFLFHRDGARPGGVYVEGPQFTGYQAVHDAARNDANSLIANVAARGWTGLAELRDKFIAFVALNPATDGEEWVDLYEELFT